MLGELLYSVDFVSDRTSFLPLLPLLPPVCRNIRRGGMTRHPPSVIFFRLIPSDPPSLLPSVRLKPTALLISVSPPCVLRLYFRVMSPSRRLRRLESFLLISDPAEDKKTAPLFMSSCLSAPRLPRTVVPALEEREREGGGGGDVFRSCLISPNLFLYCLPTAFPSHPLVLSPSLAPPPTLGGGDQSDLPSSTPANHIPAAAVS